jgi:Flp pilus assembly protein CpaB
VNTRRLCVSAYIFDSLPPHHPAVRTDAVLVTTPAVAECGPTVVNPKRLASAVLENCTDVSVDRNRGQRSSTLPSAVNRTARLATDPPDVPALMVAKIDV